jgi:hypothetical protein
MTQQTLKAMADKAKCEGIGCAFKHSCGRYLRPEAENQSWAAFYAFADDDCNEFEPVNNLKDEACQ